MNNPKINKLRFPVWGTLFVFFLALAGCGKEDPPISGPHSNCPDDFPNKYSIQVNFPGFKEVLDQENSNQIILSTLHTYVAPSFKVLNVRVGHNDEYYGGPMKGFFFDIPIGASPCEEKTYPVRLGTGDLLPDREDWVEIQYNPLFEYGDGDIGEVTAIEGTFTVKQLGSRLIYSNNHIIGSFDIKMTGTGKSGFEPPEPSNQVFIEVKCDDFRVCDDE